MGKFYEKPLPNYIEKREEKENLEWFGRGTSFEIFPHLNLTWQQLNEIYIDSYKKPIGDLGSSFSTIPVEGELRGIDILPIDIMHASNKGRYRGILEKDFQYGTLKEVYKKRGAYEGRLPDEIQKTMGTDAPLENYREDVEAAIKKVMDKYIVADLASIPLKDRALCVSIVSDSIPKHSPDLKTFLEKQLPEVLRVTDQVAYVYPMSIYKTIQWRGKFDYETDETFWKRVSDLTQEEIKEEELCKNTDPEAYEEEYSEKTTLEEIHLYKDSESIKQIAEAAKRLGFEFRLEKGHELEREKNKSDDILTYPDEFTRYQQREAILGIFIRRQN